MPGQRRLCVGNTSGRIIDTLRKKFHEVDAVVVSDYGYGIMTDKVIAVLAALQHKKENFLVIDAKSLDKYSRVGATVAKPNYQELVTLLSITEPAAAGHRCRADQILRTEASKKNRNKICRGDDRYRRSAIVSARQGAVPHVLEAGREHQGRGAGDTYVGALTLALASGASLEDAGEIARSAAVVILQKSGTATCTQKRAEPIFRKQQ